MFAVSYLFAYSFNIMLCVILSTLAVRLHILSEFYILVATLPSSRFPTFFVSMVGCPKCMIFGLSMLLEFARFIRLLELDYSTIFKKILSRLSSSIREDAVFPSLVGDRLTIVLCFSTLSTSILILKLSSSLQIFLLTIGVTILP